MFIMEIDYIYILIACILVIILFILYLCTRFKNKDLQQKIYKINKEAESLRGKISMIEYYHRNYREGKNPYTMMRKIADVLQGYERYEDKK